MSTSTELRPRPSARSALLRDPVLRALLLFTAAFAVWYAIPGAGAPAKLALFWPLQVVLDVIFAILSARMSALPGVSAAHRRFWRLVAVAGVFFTIGDTVQGVQTFATPVDGMVQGGAVQSGLVTLGSVIALLAMVLHPTNTAGRERLRFMLDAATVVAATAVFVWYLSPSVDLREGGGALLLALASAGVSLAGSFGLVKLMLGRNMPFTPIAGWSAGLASVLVGLSTGLTAALVEVARPEVSMLARLLPCALLAAVPRINEANLRADPDVLARRTMRPFSLLPYFGVLAAYVLLIVSLSSGSLDARVWGVVIGVLLVTGIVVTRQLIAFTDNARLLGEVDRSLRALAEQEERFRGLVQHSSDITLIAGPDHIVSYASPAVERTFGVPPESVIGLRMNELTVAEARDEWQARLADLLTRPGASVTMQLQVPHIDGRPRWLSAVATNLIHLPGIRGVVYNAHDITEVVAFQDRLRHEATHDALTGLANRALFAERIAVAGKAASILIIDLDGFKAVNDTYGHHAGDALLRAVAERLRRCVRPTDTVARLGGDEFAVLLPDTALDYAEELTRRLHEVFAEPVHLDGALIPIRASIGAAHGSLANADGLLRDADAAMYAVKHGARDLL
ncbi:GGDEF domain-containing protein [Dactylosporangium vinaceum]|uniref:Diguanylate cyclase domain-containing protein n=1 Tax=Dactylosporangium vinaceum TaxID=53362 RepID=A0ABV5MFT2_9ACTN|nr:sensor domain-containing diguanylate cyclase [Dactylosporangium vinaceum]UAB98837.1 GGDEF domain-containing protein [Dactylosporangium vinaceum]